jgi:hypothetical protein
VNRAVQKKRVVGGRIVMDTARQVSLCGMEKSAVEVDMGHGLGCEEAEERCSSMEDTGALGGLNRRAQEQAAEASQGKANVYFVEEHPACEDLMLARQMTVGAPSSEPGLVERSVEKREDED